MFPVPPLPLSLEAPPPPLSHAVPNRSLEEVHLRALRLLVDRLEKQKYGTPRPKPPVEHATSEPAPAVAESEESSPSASASAVAAGSAPPRVKQSKMRAHAPRQRGAASVRREVRQREGLQCTFVDDWEQRCRETRFLELHHELAHALGGRETVRNLTLRCQAHNALAAEQDFGQDFMRKRIPGRSRQRR